MRRALLDANFLLVPAKFKVDIFAELERLGYKPATLSCVVHEIETLSHGKGRVAAEARVALEIIRKKSTEVIEAAGPVDDALLRTATERGCAIATNDIKLIARAKQAGIAVLRMRQKKYVVEA
ncbi:MAG: hypothetical protein QW548_03370 [Candidatus Aenigmatarchaeota archaeon]